MGFPHGATPLPCIGARVRSARPKGGGDFAWSLVFSGEKKLSVGAGALRVPVCTLYARVRVSANAHAYLRACSRACLCTCVLMHGCARSSVHMWICVRVCARASGPAVCDEGIPRQSKAAGGPSLLLLRFFSLTGN